MSYQRGNLVTVVFAGAYGKPRPALVVQSNLFGALPSVTVLLITTELRATETIRVAVKPTKQNNLRANSQVMIDKIHTIPRENAGEVFGQLESRTMLDITRKMAVFLGIGA